MSKTMTEQTNDSTETMADEPTHRRGRRMLMFGMLTLTAVATALTVSSLRSRSTRTDRRGRKSRRH
jgi:hypothetical protein